MFSSAEKTKNVNTSRQQSGGATFFRKAGEESFFGGKEVNPFFGAVQTKLSVSQPDDPYEKEADQVADSVMRMPEPAAQPAAGKEERLQLKEDEKQEEIQPKLIGSQISTIQCQEEDTDTLQAKLMACIQKKEDDFETVADGNHSQRPAIQCSGRPPPATEAPFEQTLLSSKGAGSALPETTRSFMESRFNSSFEGVRIHTGSTAQTLSRSIHAQAFAHGNDIYFNSGRYAPHTAEGGHLLAHELTHTIQQGASKPLTSTASVARKPIIQRSADAAVPQLSNAVAKAKAEEGKVNANKEGADGNREGWERLLEYFKTTFGEDKIIRNGQPLVKGAISEEQIKKKTMIDGPRPAHPRPADGKPYMRDIMPSWCGIFVFWALNKGGVPMPKWELGGPMVKPEAAYPPGYIPKAGDIAYRDNYSHYAIVEKADSNTVTSVNGNTSGEDNMGAQVQTRDHPMSDWTAFFDPLKLKTGSLNSGEGAVEEKPKTLKELRKELFNVNRKEEPGANQEEEGLVFDAETHQHNDSPELGNLAVNAKGELNSSVCVQTQIEENQLQTKEEEGPEEELSGKQSEFSLQRKFTLSPESDMGTADQIALAEGHAADVKSETLTIAPSSESISSVPVQEEHAENDRGPPVQLKADHGMIQGSWFDDAFSTVTNFVSETLAEGKRLLLAEARDFVMAIPGYRALRVVLGEDPITGEEIARNGHTFIEAAFDIMPGGRLLHEKLNSLGALDTAAAWVDQQIGAIELLVNGVLSRVSQFIESITLDRLASPRQLFEEAGNIIHQTIQSIIDFAVTAATELLETVKRFLIEQIVSFIREHTPAYPLLRVILGRDPVTDEEVLQNGTTILDALLELGGDEGREQRKQMEETGSFQKVAGWIDEGIQVFGGAYEEIKAGFLAIWNSVSIDMLMHPIDTFQLIYNQFAAPVGRVLDFVVRAGAVILQFIKEVLMQRLATWASTVRGYRLVTVIIGKDPFTDEQVPFTMENVIRGFMSLMEGGDTQYDQLKESGAIDRTTAKITAAVERLNMTPASIVQLFIDLWNSFSLNDLVDPIGAFQRIIDRFGEPIGRLIAFVVEIVRIVIETILTVMNFPFALINNIITKAMQAFEMIKRDPVGFLKNLLAAIKKGFIQFFDNIVQHLLSGLVGWLTSELKEAGVPALTDISIGGVISWILEVLGITMEKIWEKLAAHPRIGPVRVARIRSMINTLEGIWTFIKDVQERGIAAIWDKIQEQLSNLWDTILDAVKNWIMEQIVNRMVTRLLSMLDPTGIMAVINSAIALYSAIQSFIKYLREMLEIVNSFVEGVVDIASGNINTAANYLEQTMARAVPIVIGFLANQVGLNGIGRRVGEMIGRAREMVDEALTWLVNKAVDTGFAIFDRLMSMASSAGGQSLEEQYGPEKAGRINAGLQAIEAAEQPLLNTGKISEEEAQQVATTVKSNHPVFNTLTVVDGGDKWNYRFTASPPTIVPGKPKDTGLPPGVTLNVGDSILDKNSNTGYRVKELGVTNQHGTALRVEDNGTLFLYAQYGTRWEKPTGKPIAVGFSPGGGPTSNRTARITVDNTLRKTGTGANISPAIAPSIGYDTSGHWPRAGHLVANSLGGPGGYTSGNIVPMTKTANHTSAGMPGIEGPVLRDIIATDAVYDYAVAVTYNPAVQLPPVQVVVTATRLYPTTTLPPAVAATNSIPIKNT